MRGKISACHFFKTPVNPRSLRLLVMIRNGQSGPRRAPEKADTFKVSCDAPHLVCLRGNCRETRVTVNGARRHNRGDARSDEYRGLGQPVASLLCIGLENTIAMHSMPRYARAMSQITTDT
jgi:hypothetical protein